MAGFDRTKRADDAVSLLVEQHDEVRALLKRIPGSSGRQRQAAFDMLRELLARHETAEEMVLRPLTRAVPDGETIAQARMDEENSAKQDLAALEKLDIDGRDFDAAFAAFGAAVSRHADAEEGVEFAALRLYTEAHLLSSAREKLQKVEHRAPTHPHPSAKTTQRNYVLGPFAALLDRVRDAISRRRS
jgi:hypothetical protein